MIDLLAALIVKWVIMPWSRWKYGGKVRTTKPAWNIERADGSKTSFGKVTHLGG
jgi:hypothetical protein